MDQQLLPFLEKAHQWIANGQVGEIDFGFGVYQVEVKDPQFSSSLWPFLHLDDSGKIKDAFCECEKSPCIHVTAAYLKIFSEHARPLHVRYFQSFWHHLFLFWSEHYGIDSLDFHNQSLILDKKLSVCAKSTPFVEKLKHLFHSHLKETPENSIKFANISSEEITLWKQGRPSVFMRYLLSNWCELGKLLFLNEEVQVPSYHIEEDEKGLPSHIFIGLEDYEIKISLDLEELIFMIPFLNLREFPLKVSSQPVGERLFLRYDESKQVLHVESLSSENEKQISPLILNEHWTYYPDRGFFPQSTHGKLDARTFEAEEIGELLDEKASGVIHLEKNFALSERAIRAKYEMNFDKEWNWHFTLYKEHPGDLSQEGCALFGKWAYFPKRGFFPLEHVLFPDIHTVIQEAVVGDFIHQHKIWLSSQKDFKTHLAGVESSISYSVHSENGLSFHSRVDQESLAHDFGDWMYFHGEGFFYKKSQKIGGVVKAGLSIPRYQIPKFIKMHKDELEGVNGFFSSSHPAYKRGIEIDVIDEDTIQVEPKAVFPEGVEGLFFDDYVYIRGEGFSEVPVSKKLPIEMQQTALFSGKEAVRFLLEILPHIKDHILKIDKRLKHITKPCIEIDSLVRLREGGLKGSFSLVSGIGKEPLGNLIHAWEEKKNLHIGSSGVYLLKDEYCSFLKQIEGLKVHKNEIELSILDFFKLDAIYQFDVSVSDSPLSKITEKLVGDLRDFSHALPPEPKSLKSSLRSYQQVGLSWLWFLFSNGLSGILCDDMGLGKTHQSMALMASILNSQKGKQRFLVVCPTSVVYHWEDKLAQFLPDTATYVFHGQRRKLPRKDFSGVLITSYGTLRVEKERLANMDFTLAIYDEMQVVKNARSRTHQAIKQMNAAMHLGLTGTPIENSLEELKALFDLVLPGLMPSIGRFRQMFVNPIEREMNLERRALLSALIRPFILRRKKQEVLKELPLKSEDKVFCLLSEEQKKLYQEITYQADSQWLHQLKSEGENVPYVHIFSLLGKLKQVCNHPALVHKDPENYENYSSGKWETFTEKLSEALDSNQKVVVFSQYLQMLDIMKLHLEKLGVEFAEIRGETLDRRQELKRFQQDAHCRVFLGSLNAAGLGIDLTAATVVIFYDRWWNAARENQATDRVHRMGQKRGVQVFKLITKGTLEEKIDALITKKGKLMEEVVTQDEADVIKTFTREELIEILTLSK